MKIHFELFLHKHILYKLQESYSASIYPYTPNNILEMYIVEISPSKRYVKIECIPGNTTEWYDIETLSNSLEIVEVLNDNRTIYE